MAATSARSIRRAMPTANACCPISGPTRRRASTAPLRQFGAKKMSHRGDNRWLDAGLEEGDHPPESKTGPTAIERDSPTPQKKQKKPQSPDYGCDWGCLSRMSSVARTLSVSPTTAVIISPARQLSTKNSSRAKQRRKPMVNNTLRLNSPAPIQAESGRFLGFLGITGRWHESKLLIGRAGSFLPQQNRWDF